jgi:hypothetical protein
VHVARCKTECVKKGVLSDCCVMVVCWKESVKKGVGGDCCVIYGC